MPFDGIFISNILNELSSAVGSRIEKVYQPSKDDIVLLLGNRGFNKKLLISVSGVGPRMHFTDYSFDNPPTPPMLCMLVRKHFLNARLEGVYQHGLDRVVTLKFSGFNELGDLVELSVVVEFFGRQSNIIFTRDNKIIDAVRRSDIQSEGRTILPGAAYEFPDSQNKLSINETDNEIVYNTLSTDREKSFIDVLDGVSPLISRELQYLSEKNGISYAIDLLRKSVNNGHPVLLKKDGQHFDYTYIPIEQYGKSVECICFDSFSKLLDEYYSSKQKESDIKHRSQEIRKLVSLLIERTSRRIEKQKSELKRGADMEKLRVFGELIKANMHLISPGAAFVDLPNYYDADLALARIPLKPELSASQNAQRYFKEYRKANVAREVLTELIEKGERELTYLYSVAEELNRAQTSQELAEIKGELESQGYIRSIGKAKTKSVKSLPPLRFLSSSGKEILVGRNNRQNDALTKSVNKHDVWLHTKGIHGSHAVIVLNGEELDEITLNEAAVICAYHSDARDSSSVPVDYCPVRNVKKPNGAPPGMVIYDKYNTVYVKPDLDMVKKLKK